MGSSKSKTVKSFKTQAPLKSALKRTTVVTPKNGHKYYPNPHPPEQYFHPPRNQGDSNQNRLHSQSSTKNTAPQPPQQTPKYHDNQDTNPSHRHHSHQHHHHQSQTSSEKGNFAGEHPIPQLEREPTMITYHIASAVDDRQLPPSSQSGHQPSSVFVKNNPSANSMKNSSPATVVKQHRSMNPAFLASSNSFEKAPPSGRIYIATSPDHHSVRSSTTGPLTVVRQSASQNATPGNRWYDHDYDRRVKSYTNSDAV